MTQLSILIALAITALWLRAEWLQAARDRAAQTELTYAAEVSADYWFSKYYARERSRPGASERDVHREMAARHRELNRKWEKMQRVQESVDKGE